MENTGSGQTMRRGTDAIKGIPSDSTIVRAGSTTDLISETNTKWLYVNPIIGRVLNGYAITEAAVYRPYEDGTRTYSDGSKEYWQTNGTVTSKSKDELEADPGLDSTMKASASAVTMRNGSKHYSITDINQTEKDKFVMNGIADNSNITVSSAQALFIMSLITQNGLGKSQTGQYSQTNKAVAATMESNYLTPYNSYMAAHLADYSYVGNVDSSVTTEPSAAIASPSTDVDKASNDYYNAKTNDKYAGSGTDKVPHIIKEYTNTLTVNSSAVYPAFDCSGDTEHFFNLILSGSDTTFYLPDSYRGLGSLMFGGSRTDNLDNYKENVVFLYSFDGGEKNISMNMNLQFYSVENYTTFSGSQGNWKSGTKFTLVDSSNNGKVYYMGNFVGGNTDQVIDFSAFKDEQNNPYVPLPLYDILNVVVEQVESGASLVQVKDGDDISTATVFYDGHYYKPNPGSSYSYDNNGTPVTYSAEDTKYAVTSVSASPETYYLSIFTPKATVAVANDPETPEDETVAGEPVHHFSFTSPDKLTNRTNEDIPQSKIKGSSTKTDLYTGDLYEINFTSLNVISNTTNDQKMTASNNRLTVTMNTTLQLTQNAKNAHIYENLASAANASIYQTFLMTYSMKADENSSPKAGIQPGSSPDEGYISYTINGDPVTGTGKKINKNLNYIEFANGVNLKQYLTDVNGSAEIEMSARIEYDPGNLPIQFPPNTEGANNGVGTNVIAYSKIASSVENIANSSTLKKQINNTLYFSDIDSSASLKYSLDFEKSGNDPAGLYNDLGINAFEMFSDTSVINTEARYDTSMINTSEDFIELTIRLSNRSAYASWLPLNKYFKSLNVYGSDGTTDLLTKNDPDNIKVTQNQNDYIIRVNKDLLQTEGDKVYIFPIKLEVYTGNGKFNSSRDTNNDLIGLMYSNYMVKLTAEMYGSLNGNDSLPPSHAEDHLIYTNARLDPSMM